MTGLDYIKDAFALLGVYSPGQDIPAAHAQTALRQINRMLGTWSADIDSVYSETQDTLVLTPGDASYTVGPTGDLVTSKPLNLLEAHIHDSAGIDHSLRVVPFREYQEIILKTSPSTIPQVISWNPTNPNVSILLWPVPNTNYTLYITSEKALASVTLAGEYVVPDGYDDAIVWNLAVLLAPVYGRQDAIGNMQDHASIAGQAYTKYKGILVSNISIAGVGLDPLMPLQQNTTLRNWRYDD